MGMHMQKDELIQLHTFLLIVRHHLEEMNGKSNAQVFSSYEKLNVGPHQLYKTKGEQKRAIFSLSKGILELLRINNISYRE